jgi:hypothetical protein
MPKVAKKRSRTPAKPASPAVKLEARANSTRSSKKPPEPSKQSRVIVLLRSPKGATIGAMMTATGWQQHSVRGFLAGVVRKRLKLKLGSEVVDGTRVYRIAGPTNDKPDAPHAKRR